MERSSRALIPILRKWTALNGQPTRTFFSRRALVPFVDSPFSQLRQLDRHFDRIEQDLLGGFLNPWKRISLPEFVTRSSTPMTVYEAETPGKYQVNVVIGDGIPAENIKVSLVDRMVRIEAKYEHKSEDGTSSVSQEFMRQFTLPENVDPGQVKSLLTPEGILQIEAPLPIEEGTSKVKEIPINIGKIDAK